MNVKVIEFNSLDSNKPENPVDSNKTTCEYSFECKSCRQYYKIELELTEYINQRKLADSGLNKCKSCYSNQQQNEAIKIPENCNLSDQEGPSRNGSKERTKLKHKKAKAYSCGFCEKCCTTAASFSLHMKKHIREGLQFTSEFTSKQFVKKEEIKAHEDESHIQNKSDNIDSETAKLTQTPKVDKKRGRKKKVKEINNENDQNIDAHVKPESIKTVDNVPELENNDNTYNKKERKRSKSKNETVNEAKTKGLKAETALDLYIEEEKFSILKSKRKRKKSKKIKTDNLYNELDREKIKIKISKNTSNNTINENVIRRMGPDLSKLKSETETETPNEANTNETKNEIENDIFENKSENNEQKIETDESSQDGSDFEQYFSKKVNIKKRKPRRTVHFNKKEFEKFKKQIHIDENGESACSLCNKRYTSKRWLFIHIQEHKVTTAFQCRTCLQYCQSRDDLKLHREKEHFEELTCTTCLKTYSCKLGLRKHIETHNRPSTGRRKLPLLYVCQKCGQQFSELTRLKRHERYDCKPAPRSTCPTCGDTFASKYIMQSHMRVHNAVKPLLCKYCAKTFNWKEQLDIHERIHTGEKPFQCLECPKAFNYVDSLKRHISVHTGIKPYACDSCGSRFSCIGNLIQHHRRHEKTCGKYVPRKRANRRTDTNGYFARGFLQERARALKNARAQGGSDAPQAPLSGDGFQPETNYAQNGANFQPVETQGIQASAMQHKKAQEGSDTTYAPSSGASSGGLQPGPNYAQNGANFQPIQAQSFAQIEPNFRSIETQVIQAKSLQYKKAQDGSDTPWAPSNGGGFQPGPNYVQNGANFGPIQMQSIHTGLEGSYYSNNWQMETGSLQFHYPTSNYQQNHALNDCRQNEEALNLAFNVPSGDSTDIRTEITGFVFERRELRINITPLSSNPEIKNESTNVKKETLDDLKEGVLLNPVTVEPKCELKEENEPLKMESDDDNSVFEAPTFDNNFDSDNFDSEDNLPLKTFVKPKKLKKKRSTNANSFRSNLKNKNYKADYKNFLEQTKFEENGSANCEICDKHYTNGRWFYQHFKNHQKPNAKCIRQSSKHKCEICSASCNSRKELCDHQMELHSESLVCTTCLKKYVNVKALRKHERIHQTTLEQRRVSSLKYVCQKCGKQFSDSTRLKTHEEFNCNPPRSTCSICEQTFASKWVLKNHMRIHDPSRRLLCKYCAKTFNWKEQLDIHERIHTGEKPYKCNECGKAFNYVDSLKRHISLHTGIKPYMCNSCGGRFSCIGNLIAHHKTHEESCGKYVPRRRSDKRNDQEGYFARGFLQARAKELKAQEERGSSAQLEASNNVTYNLVSQNITL